MRTPSKLNSQENLLNAQQKAEHEYLSRVAPTFGRKAPEDYAERAAKFNADCKAIGATMMMVVEV